MAFTTQIFTFGFFPVCMILYYLAVFLEEKSPLKAILKKCRLTDLALIGISFGFYMWACIDDIFGFAAYIVLVYLLGLAIYEIRQKGFFLVAVDAENNQKKFSLALPVAFLGIAGIVGLLIHFKYTGLLADFWNLVAKDNLSGKSIIAPLGISFITFSAISYLADIYMGKAAAGNLIDCAL